MSYQTETATIYLGGESYLVQAFTFDQLQKLLPAFARLQAGLGDGGLAAARDILAVALDGQLTTEQINALRTTVPEILQAIPVIADVSGLTALGEMIRRD